MANDTVIDIALSGAVSPMSGNASRLLLQHNVLGKYQAEYFYDEKIGYIFVREPHWLDEAYTDAISAIDTGVLGRNLGNIELISRCLANNTRHQVSSGVDLGAGYGLFVRGMRDAGFDFYWSDKYAKNLMAKGFEAKPGAYEIAVAFEVLEHLTNPIEFLRNARVQFQFHTCFFSATCFDEEKLPGPDWWYWAFEGGQHISFFSQRALLWMAEQLEMQLWHIERDVFAFSNLEWQLPVERLGMKLWRRIRSRVDRLLLPQKAVSRESLLWSDHLKIRDRLRDMSGRTP